MENDLAGTPLNNVQCEPQNLNSSYHTTNALKSNSNTDQSLSNTLEPDCTHLTLQYTERQKQLYINTHECIDNCSSCHQCSLNCLFCFDQSKQTYDTDDTSHFRTQNHLTTTPNLNNANPTLLALPNQFFIYHT